MTKRLFIYPYKNTSKSVINLAKRLKKETKNSGLIISSEGSSKFKPSKDKVILNWGSHSDRLAEFNTVSRVLNKPSEVKYCSNKFLFFNMLSEKGLQEFIPEYTSDYETFRNWFLAEEKVVGRETLTGHSGEGIVISDEEQDYTNCRMWVKYIPKLEEYRIHVFDGEIIDVQQKKLRTTDDLGNKVDPKKVNWQVRNHRNGFIYARQDVEVPKAVLDTTKTVSAAVALDFGAYDVIYNKKKNKAFVLEVNTAPGLEGSTLDSYVNKLKNYL